MTDSSEEEDLLLETLDVEKLRHQVMSAVEASL